MTLLVGSCDPWNRLWNDLCVEWDVKPYYTIPSVSFLDFKILHVSVATYNLQARWNTQKIFLWISWWKNFNNWSVTAKLLASIKWLCFVYNSSDRVSAASQHQMMQVQETLIEVLQSLIASSHPHDAGLFPRLLMMMSSLRELSLEYRRMFTSIRDSLDMNDNLQSEILEILGLMWERTLLYCSVSSWRNISSDCKLYRLSRRSATTGYFWANDCMSINKLWQDVGRFSPY